MPEPLPHPELWIRSRTPESTSFRFSAVFRNCLHVPSYLSPAVGWGCCADLPLDPGRAPAWLFTRMTRRAREIATHVVADRGAEELLRRLSDPFWFQAFGCVLGFDWHSSGVTTTSRVRSRKAFAASITNWVSTPRGVRGALHAKPPWKSSPDVIVSPLIPGP